jgi:hypothetical protein
LRGLDDPAVGQYARSPAGRACAREPIHFAGEILADLKKG